VIFVATVVVTSLATLATYQAMAKASMSAPTNAIKNSNSRGKRAKFTSPAA
jgi:hypothetical protein